MDDILASLATITAKCVWFIYYFYLFSLLYSTNFDFLCFRRSYPKVEKDSTEGVGRPEGVGYGWNEGKEGSDRSELN